MKNKGAFSESLLLYAGGVANGTVATISLHNANVGKWIIFFSGLLCLILAVIIKENRKG